ncbi:MAG: MFS transporter [Alphaproteobacteria bacterium]|nr:MFS transporter [Alphaproteobacteria bacterium]
MQEKITQEKIIDVGQFIDNTQIRPFHIMIMLLCGATLIMDGYCLISMGVAVKRIGFDWGLAPSVFGQNGWLGIITPMSGALFGVIFGSSMAGFAADKIGRKYTLIAMTWIAASFMYLTATATTFNELIFYRLGCGFGAGGSIPIAIALISEFAPKKYRNLMVVITYSGAPLGSTVLGFTGAALIERYDWPGIFYFGAFVPMAICVLLFLCMEESVKYLTSKTGTKTNYKEKIKKILTRLGSKEAAHADGFVLHEVKLTKTPLLALFTDRRATISLLLWVIFFATQFVLFIVSLWLPTVLQEAGATERYAFRAVGNYNFGAFVMSIILGVLADRFSAMKVLLFSFPLSALFLASLGYIFAFPTVFLFALVVAGGMTIGSAMCLAPLVASLYPTAMRSTGIGAALSVGRAGSIISPMVGAWIVHAALGVKAFYFVAACAPVLAACGLFSLYMITRRRINYD